MLACHFEDMYARQTARIPRSRDLRVYFSPITRAIHRERINRMQICCFLMIELYFLRPEIFLFVV